MMTQSSFLKRLALIILVFIIQIFGKKIFFSDLIFCKANKTIFFDNHYEGSLILGTYENPFNNFSQTLLSLNQNDNISLIIHPKNIIEDFDKEIFISSNLLIQSFDYIEYEKAVLIINFNAKLKLKFNLTIVNLAFQFEDLLDINHFIIIEDERISLIFKVFLF